MTQLSDAEKPMLTAEEINAFREMMKGPNPDSESIVIKKIDALCDMALQALPVSRSQEA